MQTTTFPVACTSCSAKYRVAAANAGKKMKCKHCGEIFAIPAFDEPGSVLATADADANQGSRPSRPSPVAKLSTHSTTSIRARHSQKREGFRITPMHIVFAVAIVLVAIAYLKWCK